MVTVSDSRYRIAENHWTLAAVRSALDNTGKVILKDHMCHCVAETVADGGQEAIDLVCKVMGAVACFEKGNNMLAEVLQELGAE